MNYLIGCGGVGSAIVPSFCLLKSPADITLIDGDKIEIKNLNRQLFDARQVGMNKAEALAAKYNCRFIPEWFARGKLWASPEDARAERDRPLERRHRSWRPGGDHRDRRESFKTAARERNQARRQKRFARKQRAQGEHQTDNRSDRTKPQIETRSDRPRTPRKTAPGQNPRKRHR